LEQLTKYYSDPTLTFLAAAMSTPSKHPYAYPSETSHFFGDVKQAEEIDRMGLQLFSLFYSSHHGDTYKEFLAGFLTMKARSQHCVLNSQHYSIAAQESLKYLHKDRHLLNHTINRKPGESRRMGNLIAWVLDCLPIFLDQSIETGALVQAARYIEFNSIVGNFPAAESVAKAAITRYLSRCREVSY